MGRMSHGEFQEYLGLLGRLLRLRTTRRTAIEDELRAHMEERFAALTGQGLEPERAIRMALAEFGDAATLAAEFSAISRLQKRRWMMRLTVGSIAATLVLSAAVISMWPADSGGLLGSQAHAQPVGEETAAAPAAEPLSETEANARTQLKLDQLISAECPDRPLNEALAYIGALADVQVHIDTLALENEQLTVEEPVSIDLKDVPAELVFRLALAQHGLVYSLDHGVLIATTPKALATKLEIRVYRIGDLVQPAAVPAADPMAGAPKMVYGTMVGAPGAVPTPRDFLTELTALITATVEPKTWDRMGGPGTVGEYRGTLVVSQTPDAHRKIDQLLDGLRTALAEEK